MSYQYQEEYYSAGIAAAEAAGLPETAEIVLFSWTYDFDKWTSRVWGRKVVWDTHIYHFGATSLQAAEQAVQSDVQKVLAFAESVNTQRSGSEVLVGEYTLAGISTSYEEWAEWNARTWGNGTGLAGSAIWNFDAPSISDAWSVVGQEARLGVNWRDVWSQ